MELYNTSIEQAVLAALMGGACKSDDVERGLFYHDKHRWIYDAIAKLRTPGIASVADKLRTIGRLEASGGESYLTEIAERISPDAPLDEYISILGAWYRKRQLQQLAQSIINDIEEPDQTIERVEAELADLRKPTTDEYVNIGEMATEIARRFCTDTPPDPGTYFETRIFDLNEKIGGVFRGELTIIAAEPSQGKTAFATDLCLFNGKTGHKSLIITLDEQTTAIATKVVASISGVPARQLQTVSPLGSDKEKAAAQDAAISLKDRGVFVAERPDLNIHEMRSFIRRVVRREKIDIVVLDYIQNLRPKDEKQTIYDKVSEASRICKYIALECDVAMVVISQLRRESNRVSASFDVNKLRQPTTDRLLGSGMLTADANLVLFPWRPVAYIDQYVRNDDTSKPDLMDQYHDAGGEKATIIIGKQKMGEIGDVDVYFNPKQMRFTQRDEVPF